MMTRRELLIASGINSSNPVGSHLDLGAAKEVKAQFLQYLTEKVDDVLDLSMFRTASADGIRYLAKTIPQRNLNEIKPYLDCECAYAEFGLVQINPEIATALSDWNLDYMPLDKLLSIDVHSAEILLKNEPQLSLGILSLTTDTAMVLSKSKRTLALTSLHSISIDAARSLACHTGDLIVRLKARLNPIVATELVQHKGEILTIDFDQQPDPIVIASLSSNHGKHTLPIAPHWKEGWRIEVVTL